jgi:hypothetical protein
MQVEFVPVRYNEIMTRQQIQELYRVVSTLRFSVAELKKKEEKDSHMWFYLEDIEKHVVETEIDLRAMGGRVLVESGTD